MTGAAAHAVEPRGGASAPQSPAAATAAAAAKGAGGREPARKAAPVTMEHVLLALHETEAEREARIRDMFAFFDAAGRGQLDYAQIEAGLAALQVPAECKYARELLRACDRDRDGRVGYDDFRRYMDDKELELYRIFQAIDVEHNGCILPEELWDALVKAGMCFLGQTLGLPGSRLPQPPVPALVILGAYGAALPHDARAVTGF